MPVRRGTALLAVLALACSEHGADAPHDAGVEAAPCTGLFGKPTTATGAVCSPQCACGDQTWAPPAYTSQQIDALAQWTLLEPPAPLADDPYTHPQDFPAHPDQVCGVLPDATQPHAYRLVSYDSADAAVRAGAIVTHYGACGLCSPLVDLAVYMRHGDLVGPVRSCALMVTPDGGTSDAMACLQALGFDEPCADIWLYNAVNTRAHCLSVCLADLSKPYQSADGTLNDCLQCDEDQSGPVFKAVAGRTRRSSGLPSAICRPCDSVRHVIHSYP